MLRAACIAVTLLCGFIGGPVAASAEASGGRNILLIVTDDQSPDAGCYGNDVIHTPNLDRLAAEGLRMDAAFCTTASCSASRSVILTGLYNHANAQYGHEHDYHHFRTYEHIKSLPVRLAAEGYRTARIGKLHVGPESVYHFETVLPGSARSPVVMANNCREFLAAKDARPFFLYFCTADPHRSGQAVGEELLAADDFGNRAQGYPGIEPVTYSPEQLLVPPFLPDRPTCRAELAQYYQSISRVDQGLGRLIDLLRELDLYDDTLIIFTSDHGMAFPGAKTTTYEGGLRIPMVIRHPRLTRPGSTSDAMVSLVDLAPTLLEFAGVAGDGLHGRSMLPVLREPTTEGWDEIYASHTFHEITMYYPMRVVRTRRYKLIWNIAHGLPFPFASDLWSAATWQDVLKQGPQALYGRRTVHDYIHRPKFELYDLQDDPHEVHNLADKPEHQEMLEQLSGKLKAFQTRTADPWKLKWDYE